MSNNAVDKCVNVFGEDEVRPQDPEAYRSLAHTVSSWWGGVPKVEIHHVPQNRQLTDTTHLTNIVTEYDPTVAMNSTSVNGVPDVSCVTDFTELNIIESRQQTLMQYFLLPDANTNGEEGT